MASILIDFLIKRIYNENMNPWKITKLDRRHTGHQMFTHSINYNVGFVQGKFNSRQDCVRLFAQHREWFWEFYGSSSELGIFAVTHWSPFPQDTQSWAWHSDGMALKIYVSDKALSHFTLTHST